MNFGTFLSLQDHALLTIWLVFLHWTAYVPLAWAVIRHQAPFMPLGLGLSMALGLAVGLLANFQAFFFLVVVLKHFSLLALVSLSLMLSVGMLALLRWSVRQWPVPASRNLETVAHGHAMNLLAGLAVLTALGLFIAQVLPDTPGVFVAWDAVVSWNRWATEWTEHVPPGFTMGYPQLLPTGLASVYAWLGSQKVEPVARGFMLIFPLGICMLFWDGFRRLKNPAFLFGMACWMMMLRFVLGDMADSGYADVPAAFFVALAAYLLLLGHLRQIPGELAFLGSALGCAAAVLTKQPGGIAWVLWLTVAALHAPLRRSLPAPWRFLFICCVVFIVLAAPWYIYTAWKIKQGTDVTNLGYLVSTIHGDRGVLGRVALAFKGPIATALEGLGSATVAGGVMGVLLIFALRLRLGLTLVLSICLPYVLLWAVLFSYDIRNIMPVVPVLCLALGLGTTQALRLVYRGRQPLMGQATAREHLDAVEASAKRWLGPAWHGKLDVVRKTLPSMALVIGGLTALVPLSTHDIENLQTKLQRQSLHPALNEALLRYARSPGFEGMVVTTYAPMIMIEELQRSVPSFKTNPNASPELQQALQAERPWCEIQALAPHWRDVRYLLLHKPFLQAVVDRGLRDGTLHLELEMDGVRLVKILCPA